MYRELCLRFLTDTVFIFHLIYHPSADTYPSMYSDALVVILCTNNLIQC